MAAFEQHRPNTWVLTQNVDGLHHSAGQKNLIEIHGRADELFCTKCGQRTTAAQLIQNYGGSVVLPPQCASCSGMVRPDVVLFGEMLPGQAVRTMERIFSGPLHLVVMVGTSAQFPYITEPVRIARARAIPSVEINPGDTPISGLVDFKLSGGAAETLDQLWGMTFGR
jgi:NAD-dependent deacetylase